MRDEEKLSRFLLNIDFLKKVLTGQPSKMHKNFEGYIQVEFLIFVRA